MNSEIILWLLVTLVGIGGSALCSGTEIGLYSVNRVRLKLRAAGSGRNGPGESPAIRRRAQRLDHLVSQTTRTLTTLLIANSVFNNLGAIGISALLGRAELSDSEIIVINALILTPVLLVFAETLPKELFRIHADSWTYKVTPLLRWAGCVLTWTGFIPLVAGAMRIFARFTGAPPDTTFVEKRQLLASLLKESAHAGVLSETQSNLVDRALAMQDVTVADEMVPWNHVKRAHLSWKREELLGQSRTLKHARLPVVDARNRVVGIVEIIDVVLGPELTISEMMHVPLRLSPDTGIREAMKQLRARSARMAIVEQDDRPVGIVTAKDLVEPFTGELEAW